MSLTIGYPRTVQHPFRWFELSNETRLETFDDMVDLLQRLSEVLPAAIVLQGTDGLVNVLKVARIVRRHAQVPIHLVLDTVRSDADLAAVPGIVSVHGADEGYGRLCWILASGRPVAAPRNDTAQIQFGELRMDLGRRKAFVRGDDLRLTRKEFDILRLLASERDVIIRRQQLLDVVWGIGWVGASNVLDTHVVKLRSKLAAAGATTAIVNVRGIGFFLDTSEMPELVVVDVDESA